MTFSGRHQVRDERSCRVSTPAALQRDDQGLGGSEQSPGGRLEPEVLGSRPRPPLPREQGEKQSPTGCTVPPGGHGSTSQRMVTFNWLMSRERFEDEKYQVGIITIRLR